MSLSSHQGGDRMFNNADSFAQAFDQAWQLHSRRHPQQGLSASDKLALVLAELAEQKRIDMTTPIGDLVPSLKGKRVGAVTTQQLMTHSAGWLDNAVAYGRMGEGALGEVMREVSDTLFYTEPGRTFSYSNQAGASVSNAAACLSSRRWSMRMRCASRLAVSELASTSTSLSSRRGPRPSAP